MNLSKFLCYSVLESTAKEHLPEGSLRLDSKNTLLLDLEKIRYDYTQIHEPTTQTSLSTKNLGRVSEEKRHQKENPLDVYVSCSWYILY